MKLLKIGRDASCNIVLHSEKVSSLHAELTLLNSGDIMLEDKGSRNGTFIMNQPIKPGKPVNVRRGDAIRFADVELQWSQVPMPEDNSAYKGIYGIGSHFNNDFQISGATVSRYHATVKHGKDGKFYIVDHSKNGTTVDGTKIAPNTPYRIKKSSAVVCGGVPVDLSRLPWPAPLMKYISGIAATIVIVCGVIWGLKIGIPNPKPSLQSLQNATACVYEEYYITATFKDDPFTNLLDSWPKEWCFGLGQNGKFDLGIPGETIQPFGGLGTAFFISPYGELGTNRHIACPWENIDPSQEEIIRQRLQKMIQIVKGNSFSEGRPKNIEEKFASELNTVINIAVGMNLITLDNAIAYLERLSKSEIIFSGRFTFLGVIQTGSQVSNSSDMLTCQVIATSDDEKRDVALMRLNSKKTPDEIIEQGYYDIEDARLDEKTLLPQEEELTIIGYPQQFGTGQNIISDGKEYLPTVHRTYTSKTPDDNMFQLQSNVVGGQSGSPIVDEDHQLVGVVWGSIRGTDVAYGCNIKHLKGLYDKHKVNK